MSDMYPPVLCSFCPGVVEKWYTYAAKPTQLVRATRALCMSFSCTMYELLVHMYSFPTR